MKTSLINKVLSKYRRCGALFWLGNFNCRKSDSQEARNPTPEGASRWQLLLRPDICVEIYATASWSRDLHLEGDPDTVVGLWICSQGFYAHSLEF